MRVGLLLIASTLLVYNGIAQRLQGWDAQLDAGTRFDALIGSGIGSFQWGQLRGQQEVPPRTVRHARINNIRVIDGGDPFGRVVLLWSGWEGNGTDRTEFWLQGAYKSPPIYQPAQVGQTFSGSDLFRIRMWNEQYFTWQPRSVVTSVYVANAPQLGTTSLQNPSWTDLNALDLRPNQPGVQVDPAITPQIQLNLTTGSQRVSRPLVSGLRRVVSLDNYITESRPSPFRDVVVRDAVLSWRINSAPQNPISDQRTIDWTPLDSTIDRTIANVNGSLNVPLTNLPRGTVVSFDYSVQLTHTPYNAQGQPLPPPQRQPIDDLRDADRITFDLQSLIYRYSGAISGNGSVSDSDAPPTCIPKNLGSLDITLNLQDFGLPYNISVTFAGRAVSGDVIEWTVDAYPDLCIPIEGVNVKIKRVWGKLTTQLIRQPQIYDPLCNRNYSLVLVPIGGDSGNWLNGELYALCQEVSFTRVNVEVRSIAYSALSGLTQEISDPRILYRYNSSQWIETILWGDVNEDGCVDDSDLMQILFQFGQVGATPADLNGDGRVDDADLLIVLLRFGACY